jgi:hypothetical protein
MFVVAIVAVAALRISGTRVASLGQLILLSVACAVIGAFLTLLYTVAWMIWYEKTTGFSAGNAPIAWIFFYGPLGLAFGQLVALLLWWRKRPHAPANHVA